MAGVLHGKRGRILFFDEPFSGSELGLLTLGEALLGIDEADANGLEVYKEFIKAYMWRLITDTEIADTSHFSNEWREFIGGMARFTGRMEGLLDPSDEGQTLLDEFFTFARSYAVAHLYTDINTGYIKAGMQVNLRDIDVNIGDAQKVAFDFVNHGRPEWVDLTAVPLLDLNLVGHWAFNEGSGIVAADSTPYGNNGTLVSSPLWVPGKYSNALQFNAGSRVEIAKAHPLQHRYFLSISLWFKLLGAPDAGNVHGLVGDDAGTAGWRLLVNHSTGTVTFAIGSSSVTSIETINPGNWNHIVATYHPVQGRMRIYINRVLDMNEGTRSGAVPNNLNPLRIGAIAGNANGIIDAVRMYGTELDQAIVNALADL